MQIGVSYFKASTAFLLYLFHYNVQFSLNTKEESYGQKWANQVKLDLFKNISDLRFCDLNSKLIHIIMMSQSRNSDV